VVVVASDISLRRRTEEALESAKESLEIANEDLHRALSRQHQLARTDALTGLRNRRHFFDVAEHELEIANRYGASLSLILFDVDTFKSVNDTFGHSTGDEVLRRFAGIVAGQLRRSDLVARYGGEEFVVLLPNSDRNAGALVAEKIRVAVESYRWHEHGGPSLLTASGGVADNDPPCQTVDELIRRADRALYAAKCGGRNRIEVLC
jgi:diguanylate cyclase (GGDEF)-like protein